MTWGFSAAAAGALVSGYASKQDRDSAKDSAKGSRQAIEQGKKEAREYMGALAPRAEEFRLGGYQNAQGIFGQAVPQQYNAQQHGNRQAQETTGDAGRQANNALMGLPIDYNFSRPREQFAGNFDFLNTDFAVPDAAVVPGQAQSIEDKAILDQADTTVVDMYKQYLGRDPDPSGMAYFRNMVTDDNGLVYPAGVNKMIAQMTNSDEGKLYSQNQALSQADEGFNNLPSGRGLV
tara:strand:- start:713 stop:1414 length:702 start_codon:yes stop_codon:yes gene_type:complete